VKAAYDVVVAGGGNAALCAALSARERGVSVLVLESAPRDYRGGNSRHTRNLRCLHEQPTPYLTGSYREDEFFDDLCRVSGPDVDEPLARRAIRESATCGAWMSTRGARFQTSLRGTLHLGRTNLFFLGGGKAVLNAYYARAAEQGVDVAYDAEVVGLDIAGGECRALQVRTPGHVRSVSAGAVVIASGGFEANLDWLRETWGDAVDGFVVRGTPFNTGTVLRVLLDAGIEPVGDPAACHAVAVDARAPKFDGGIVTRLDCIPFGIVVNVEGQRFADEGEDFWPKRYAEWGSLVARQPRQLAFVIIDAQAAGLFMPSVYPPIEAGSIAELAAHLQLPAEALEATVGRFNAAVQPGSIDHAALDDCRTVGITPGKSHWARRLEVPPYRAYPLRPGITFTYLGVRVDVQARVMLRRGQPARNMFAAGEVMAGNILRRGYLAGFGMTIGTVFGRIAGRGAAALARG
jgi:tricarballylate dehydrogenase